VNGSSTDARFEAWVAGLEGRHLADLTFAEVSRALRALSSTYVERRGGISRGAALTGAGKRAAFALFYAPLHFLLVAHAVAALASERAAPTLFDLGCGTGVAGAAWASSDRSIRRVVGIDRNPWALGEAARTYRAFDVHAQTQRGDVARVVFPRERSSIVAAFTMNELADSERDAMLSRLVQRGRDGDSVLIVEPLAGFVAPWWNRWREAFIAAGGRADEWRFRADLPPIVAKLDRAAGLDHREITGRSLWLCPRSA